MTVEEAKLVSGIFNAAIEYARDVVNEEFDKNYEFADYTLGNILDRLDDADNAAQKLFKILGE